MRKHKPLFLIYEEIIKPHKKITYRTYHAAQNHPQLSNAFILKRAHQTVLNIKEHPAMW